MTLPPIAVHPEAARRIRAVPDDWTVWAFTDVHGVLSGVAAALQQAGLVDAELRWIAPPGTALIGLRRLRGPGRARPAVSSSSSAGSRSRPRRPAAPSSSRAATTSCSSSRPRTPTRRCVETWLKYGGWPALASYGLSGTADEVPALLRRLDDVDPGVLAWIADLAEAVRWRDVLFVHGGLVPGGSLDDFGTTTDDHLYVRAPWFERRWDAEAFGGYEADGVGRVVFGHSPQPYGARLYHEGRSLALDTDAGRNPTLPSDAQVAITMVELRGDVSLADGRRVVVDVADAPDGVRTG